MNCLAELTNSFLLYVFCVKRRDPDMAIRNLWCGTHILQTHFFIRCQSKSCLFCWRFKRVTDVSFLAKRYDITSKKKPKTINFSIFHSFVHPKKGLAECEALQKKMNIIFCALILIKFVFSKLTLSCNTCCILTQLVNLGKKYKN